MRMIAVRLSRIMSKGITGKLIDDNFTISVLAITRIIAKTLDNNRSISYSNNTIFLYGS